MPKNGPIDLYQAQVWEDGVLVSVKNYTRNVEVKHIEVACSNLFRAVEMRVVGINYREEDQSPLIGVPSESHPVQPCRIAPLQFGLIMAGAILMLIATLRGKPRFFVFL